MTIDNLQWVEAPNHISYGTGMMEAIIPLGKDSSLHLYCPVEQIANVASALKALAQPEQEPTSELHSCPYAEEIHGDYWTLCDCDEERTRQCAQDI